MKLADITLVLGVDAKHLKELRLVWPNWMQYKPELRVMPCVVFYDEEQVQPHEMTFLRDHPALRLVPWSLPNARTQREKMLTGFIQVPAREVQTPWYLKIDTDVVATEKHDWIKDEWFEPNEKGELPVFISSPWGYSSPRYVMDVLDDWADGVPMLASKPRLNLPYSSKSSKIKHERIISWLFFARTDWTREMAAVSAKDGRLPVPSQDTFLFYCAERLGNLYRRIQMTDFGWRHLRISKIRHMLKEEHLQPSEQRATHGVVYYNLGTKCAVRLLVSLASLRQHYAGPVTILSEGDESHVLCEKIGAAFKAQVKPWDSGVDPGKNMPFLAKTRLHLGTPYEITVALDSDTLVLGSVDELFEAAERESFCVAQFGKWQTDGKIIQGRIHKWTDILPDDIESAKAFGPAINVGVMAFRRNALIFQEWYSAALKGREYFIPDEVSCQILLHRYPHGILDSRWNRSCRYDDPGLPDTRIIHYHGKKHCRPGLPFHGDKWVTVYERIDKQNLADIQSWAPAGDRHLLRHIRSSQKICSQKEKSRPPQIQVKKPVYETDLWCRRGHLNHHQADKYAEVCAKTQPKNVLEIGFCTGRSAACVLYNSPQLTRMLSIDIDLDYKAPFGRKMAAKLKKRFPIWDVLEASSKDLLTAAFFQSRYPEGIDLVTIDGDHTYEGCTFDLEAVSPHLTKHGIVMVDDYRSGPPNGTRIESVTRSVDDFLQRHPELVGEPWSRLGKGFCLISRKDSHHLML
ncbi:MAG: class I SAM-dependent methyltransferase [Verrucomicrobia bacterium]|nr:class I SAM-dependent methyltransferase [Verrucomicrobiota bacterium]